MPNIVILIGIACVLAAIVGSGVKVYNVEVSAVKSLRRQILLAAFGLVLILAGSFDGIKARISGSQADADSAATNGSSANRHASAGDYKSNDSGEPVESAASHSITAGPPEEVEPILAQRRQTVRQLGSRPISERLRGLTAKLTALRSSWGTPILSFRGDAIDVSYTTGLTEREITRTLDDLHSDWGTTVCSDPEMYGISVAGGSIRRIYTVTDSSRTYATSIACD